MGVDSVRRGGESVEAMWREGTEAASRIAQRSIDQLSRMMGLSGEAARESVEKTSGNMQAVLQSVSDVAGGLQDVTGEWMRWTQRQAEHNFDHIEQLGKCRTSTILWLCRRKWFGKTWRRYSKASNAHRIDLLKLPAEQFGVWAKLLSLSIRPTRQAQSVQRRPNRLIVPLAMEGHGTAVPGTNCNLISPPS